MEGAPVEEWANAHVLQVRPCGGYVPASRVGRVLGDLSLQGPVFKGHRLGASGPQYSSPSSCAQLAAPSSLRGL